MKIGSSTLDLYQSFEKTLIESISENISEENRSAFIEWLKEAKTVYKYEDFINILNILALSDGETQNLFFSDLYESYVEKVQNELRNDVDFSKIKIKLREDLRTPEDLLFLIFNLYPKAPLEKQLNLFTKILDLSKILINSSQDKHMDYIKSHYDYSDLTYCPTYYTEPKYFLSGHNIAVLADFIVRKNEGNTIENMDLLLNNIKENFENEIKNKGYLKNNVIDENYLRVYNLTLSAVVSSIN